MTMKATNKTTLGGIWPLILALLTLLLSQSAAAMGGPNGKTHFALEIEGMPLMKFQEVSGLGVETNIVIKETIVDMSGVQVVWPEPGANNYGTITLKRPITPNTEIWDWMARLRAGDQTGIRSGKLSLINRIGAVVVIWDYERAFPRRVAVEPGADGERPVEVIELVVEKLRRVR